MDNVLKIVIQDDGQQPGSGAAVGPDATGTATPNLDAAVAATNQRNARQQQATQPESPAARQQQQATQPVVTSGGLPPNPFAPPPRETPIDPKFTTVKQESHIQAFYEDQLNQIRRQSEMDALRSQRIMADMGGDRGGARRIEAEERARGFEQDGGLRGRVQAERIRAEADRELDQERAREASGRKLTGAINFLGAEVNAAGGAMRGFVRGNSIGAMNSAIQGGASALELIPRWGKPAAAGLRAFGEGVNQAAEVVHAFSERGRELQRYNSDLALANAQANVRRIEADIKEADKTGKNLARITDAESRISTSLQNMSGGFKKGVSEVVATGTEAAALVAETAEPVITYIGDKFGEFMEGFMTPTNEAIGILRGIKESIFGKSEKEAQKTNSVMQRWLDAVESLPIGSAPIDPAEFARDQKLAPPILGFDEPGREGDF